MKTKVNELNSLLQPAIKKLNCELWGIQWLTTNSGNILRVYIDKKAGVSLQDCEKCSHAIDMLINVENPLPKTYILEVSSPGINRPLFIWQHYEQNTGQNVRLKLHVAQNGRRNFKGMLVETDHKSQRLLIICDGHKYYFHLNMIEKANIDTYSN